MRQEFIQIRNLIAHRFLLPRQQLFSFLTGGGISSIIEREDGEGGAERVKLEARLLDGRGVFVVVVIVFNSSIAWPSMNNDYIIGI